MIANSHLVTSIEEIGAEGLDLLTITNPTYENNERLGFSNYGVPETLKLYEEDEFGVLKIPRNAPVFREGMTLEDQRVKGRKIKLKSKIDLRDEQKKAVDDMMVMGDGILQAGTGKGKSVMACEIIAREGRTTLILVHKEFLMDQFTGHLKNWLGLTENEIGYCRGNPKTWTWQDKPVVIGMLQSIYSHIDALPEGFVENFGLVISDECHRVSASTWAQVIQLFPCWKRIGLTATPKRSDGLEIVFQYHIGPIRHQLIGVNMKPVVKVIRTKTHQKDLGDIFQGRTNNINMAKFITKLSEDEDRNKQILKNLISACQSGRKVILLSDRRGQMENMKIAFDLNKEALGLKHVETRMYVGGMAKELRQEAEKNGDVLFSTFQMAKEGLDIPDLDTLFLATPNSAEITIEQSIGRIARSVEGKKEPIVVDFFDGSIGLCNALYNKRMKVYNRMELEVD